MIEKSAARLLSYNREFTFPMAHFNGEREYQLYYRLLDGEPLTRDQQIELITGIHGHNVRILIVLEGGMRPDHSWLVSDTDIEKLVLEWYNTNISAHPDFVKHRWRATTENMTLVLRDKIWDHFGITPRVTIWETDQISSQSH